MKNTLDVRSISTSYQRGISEMMFFERLRKAEDTEYRFSINGYTIEKGFDFFAQLEGTGLALRNWSPQSDVRYYNVNNHGLIRVNRDHDGEWYLDLASSDKRWIEDFAEDLATRFRRELPSNSIMVLMNSPSGLTLRSAGTIESKLEKENYNDVVNAGIDHINVCLNSAEPCGRLILLDGPPGGGKSHLIRALTSTVKATFVLISPSLMGSLSGPAVLPALLEAKEDGKAMVLVIEDADNCLADRTKNGNAGQISDLLNFGDGLLGELADVRIIATTNVDKLEMDDAVLRPGRMCRHIHIGDLGEAEALGVYKRLTGKNYHGSPSPRTLAEAYRAAREDGWTPDKVDDDPSYGDYR